MKSVIRRAAFGALIIASCLYGTTSPRARTEETAEFHHLHLNDGRPAWLADFYARLFDPSTTRRVTLWGIEGIQSDNVYLLISQPQNPVTRDVPSAIWHFGWGNISIAEDYDNHLVTEVTWETPIQRLSSGFHLHLNSQNPIGAARWYHEHLGGQVEIREPTNRVGTPGESPAVAGRKRAQSRRPEGIVRFTDVSLIFYPFTSGGQLASSRGHRADHVAFAYPNLVTAVMRLRSAGVRILEDLHPFGETRAAMVEGPDAIAIELIEVSR